MEPESWSSPASKRGREAGCSSQISGPRSSRSNARVVRRRARIRRSCRGQSIYFSVYNRGKKSICLDLRQEAGKDVFRDLVRTADFVLENFRPGTMETMGLSYDELRAIKPDIIMIRVSAFGQDSSWRDRAGYDPVGRP